MKLNKLLIAISIASFTFASCESEFTKDAELDVNVATGNGISFDGQTITVKIVLISDLVHLFDIPDTVDIKMIERHTPFLVNLYDGKCRAADWFPDTKTLRNSLRKYSFSDTKISN